MRADRGTTVTGAQPPGAPDLDNASAFLAAAGLRLTHVAADRVEGVIELGPAHHTPWGVVHGGVYTAAIESAASVGATTAVADRGQIAVGTNNNTDFLRSMTTGTGTVAVTAAPVQQGRTQQLWEVRITDQSGRVVARGTVRLQNIQPRQ
jgi:1,4-dihydroxy-2-naphthoyl-CoA hydrolase